MHQRISTVLSFLSISLLVVACTPSSTTPSGSDAEQSSAGAMMEQSSSISSQPVIMEPGADGQEENASEPAEQNEKSEPARDDGSAMSADATVDVNVNANAGMQKSSAPAAMTSDRIVTVTTANFAFSPNVIAVKKGDKITLRLKGIEGNHGFAIEALGINTSVPEGKTVDVPLPTDKAGTFGFRCSIPCGSGHQDMTGTITITE